ncbi:MAG: ComF family protein [Polaribacter sp.]|jgi:competence protein ComFC|nr:ComF family protein [Polaribacter sp.]MDP4703605.1 ComF family protein [Polaribacter sp.]
MNILNDFLRLFYPKICGVCEEQLLINEKIICTVCRHDLPLTNFTKFDENSITQKFYGRIDIEKGYSLLFFRKEGITQKIIHELKYRGNEEIGEFFGNWLGEIVQEKKEFKEVDFIIPVPLHPKKLKQRGYNQVTKFGEKLSNYLQIPYLENELVRVSATKTQTFKARFERFSNVDTKFLLKNPLFFNNKHILLIDDVITTGATLESCANEFQKSQNCKISILTMACSDLIN